MAGISSSDSLNHYHTIWHYGPILSHGMFFPRLLHVVHESKTRPCPHSKETRLIWAGMHFRMIIMRTVCPSRYFWPEIPSSFIIACAGWWDSNNIWRPHVPHSCSVVLYVARNKSVYTHHILSWVHLRCFVACLRLNNVICQARILFGA